MSTSTNPPSTQPYLIRALHEWCTDNGFTPYLAVKVDGSVQVPPEYVQNGEIVLNASYDATSNLRLGNEYVEFQARFGGVPRQIIVPVHRILAIYARENGQGMAFTVQDSLLAIAPQPQDAAEDVPGEPVSPGPRAGQTPETVATASVSRLSEKRKTGARPAASRRAPAPLEAVKPARPEADGDAPAPEPPPKTPGAGARKRPALKRIK